MYDDFEKFQMDKSLVFCGGYALSRLVQFSYYIPVVGIPYHTTEPPKIKDKFPFGDAINFLFTD